MSQSGIETNGFRPETPRTPVSPSVDGPGQKRIAVHGHRGLDFAGLPLQSFHRPTALDRARSSQLSAQRTAAMHPAFEAIEHRPYPLPERPWMLSMIWQDLVFLHWKVPADALRPHIPNSLELDLYEGNAWIGVVPFKMHRTHLRGLPPMPGSGTFPELNVCTYVRHGRTGGVWFFGLDAASWLAVQTARRFFHLPYHHARMSLKSQQDTIHYQSARAHDDAGFQAFPWVFYVKNFSEFSPPTPDWMRAST